MKTFYDNKKMDALKFIRFFVAHVHNYYYATARVMREQNLAVVIF